MRTIKNEKGNKYTRLLVIEQVGNDKYGHALWKCECDCGNSVVVQGKNLRTSNTRSCGCLQIDMAKKNRKHGAVGTKTYRCWCAMKTRCTNPKEKDYERYGARGITICDRWLNSFENFLQDMGYCPNNALTIERINNNGNYEPSNCKWGTVTEQARNRTTTKLTMEKAVEIRYLYNTSYITYKELASIYNVHLCTIFDAVKYKTWKEQIY